MRFPECFDKSILRFLKSRAAKGLKRGRLYRYTLVTGQSGYIKVNNRIITQEPKTDSAQRRRLFVHGEVRIDIGDGLNITGSGVPGDNDYCWF